MPADVPPSAPASGVGPACLRAALTGFRIAHASLWRLTCLFGKLALVLYFVFCVLFLGLRYAVLPNIDQYKPQVEQLASRALGQAVTIGRIDAGWSRFTPRLTLTDLVIHARGGADALRLPKVVTGLSWWSVVVGDLRLDTLEIDRPDLDIRREADGRLFVAGVFIDTGKSSDGRGADWILSQRRIVIRDGRVRWSDLQRQAPELVLEHLDFKLENHWQDHAFALKASPPAALAAPIDVRGDFAHPVFAARISDVAQWKGTVYADVRTSTLAGWRAWVDYPVALDEGNGSVRFWLDFDHRKVADFSADLHLADVSAQLASDLPRLELTAVDGRISLREDIATGAVDKGAAFGANGHAIALTDFSMRTRDGLTLPTTTISESFTPARNGRPEQSALTAQVLDLATLASLAERLPLPATQRRLLQDLAPRGTLRDFTARLDGAYPAVAAYKVKGKFIDLALQPQLARPSHPKTPTAPAQAGLPAIPGFDRLTGAIDATERGGSISLLSSGLTLNLPGYFAKPVIGFDRFEMDAGWRLTGKDQLRLEVAKLQFVQGKLHGSLAGTHLMPLAMAAGKLDGVVDLRGEIGGLELAHIDDYLPLATPDHLRSWLDGALLDGMLQDATVRVKGDVASFPFHHVAAATASTSPLAAGEFRIAGRIEHGKLDVAPGRLAKDGKSPLWPLIEKIEGNIVFDHTRMEIDARSAQIHGAALADVKAVIPDLVGADRLLTIDGNAAGELQSLVGFVNDSPVADWIARFTEETRTTGTAKLGLKLQMPLTRLPETKVQGVLQLNGNDVVLQSSIPALSQASGKLEFNEKGVTLNGIKANFIGGPTLVTGGSQRDGAIVIRAEGSVTADGFRRAYTAPAIQRLADRVSGGGRYGATIAVRRKRLEILVESTLQGIALDLPSPLKKAASDTLPLRFEIIGTPGDDSASLRDEIRIALGTAVSARYERQKTLDRNAAWRVVRGGIGVNVPAPQPDSGVSANVSLKTLNLDAWRSTIAAITGPGRPREAAEMPASGPVLAGGLARAEAADGPVATGASSVPVATGDPVGLTQYIEPEVLAARATELILAGKRLDNVVVGASHQKGQWQANIDSAQASGYVSWTEAPNGQGMGRVTARLSSLIIPKTAASDVTEILEGKNTATQIPGLEIIADNFELFGKKMGRLELLAANNARLAGPREWRINKLSLMNADAELKATGSWSSNDTGSLSNMVYTLDIANAGKLLERFGFANVLKGGKGRLEGELSWQGLPFSLDIPSMNGQLRIDMASGQFLKVDPGAAKLLGVLSLQSLPRRLALDFRDVFSEGFAFDGITGTVAIAQGAARTDNFKMRSVNATVIMDGTADIAKETQNLHVAVIPEINVGTASVVYGLAVNPVIGLGSFLAQLFLRDPLMRAFTFEYKITGPWKDPQVVKVDRAGVEIPRRPVPQSNAQG